MHSVYLSSALLATSPAATIEPMQALKGLGKASSSARTTTPAAAATPSSSRMASTAENRLVAQQQQQQRGRDGFAFSTATTEEDRENDPTNAYGGNSNNGVAHGQELRKYGVAIRQSSWKAPAVQRELEASDDDYPVTGASAMAVVAPGGFVEHCICIESSPYVVVVVIGGTLEEAPIPPPLFGRAGCAPSSVRREAGVFHSIAKP